MSGVGSEDLVWNIKKRRASVKGTNFGKQSVKLSFFVVKTVLYGKNQGAPTQADLTITFSKAEE